MAITGCLGNSEGEPASSPKSDETSTQPATSPTEQAPQDQDTETDQSSKQSQSIWEGWPTVTGRYIQKQTDLLDEWKKEGITWENRDFFDKYAILDRYYSRPDIGTRGPTSVATIFVHNSGKAATSWIGRHLENNFEKIKKDNQTWTIGMYDTSDRFLFRTQIGTDTSKPVPIASTQIKNITLNFVLPPGQYDNPVQSLLKQVKNGGGLDRYGKLGISGKKMSVINKYENSSTEPNTITPFYNYESSSSGVSLGDISKEDIGNNIKRYYKNQNISISEGTNFGYQYTNLGRMLEFMFTNNPVESTFGVDSFVALRFDLETSGTPAVPAWVGTDAKSSEITVNKIYLDSIEKAKTICKSVFGLGAVNWSVDDYRDSETNMLAEVTTGIDSDRGRYVEHGIPPNTYRTYFKSNIITQEYIFIDE
jgi:hypothetical protein